MDWKEFIGRKIFLETIKGYQYSGIVEEVNDLGDGHFIILLKDKFDKLVGVTNKEIKIIREERY